MLNPDHSVGIWKEELINREIKSVTPQLLNKFGLSNQSIKMVDTIEELRENPPNIVVAQSKRNFKFIQNFFKEQELKKGIKYVMGLGVFQQLQSRGNAKNKLLIPAQVKFKNLYRPYLGQQLKKGDSVLIFRTGGIGDLLFIQPNLLYLKQKYPDCIIKFACGPQYQPMVEAWDCVDEVLDLPFTLKALMESTYHILFEGVIERCKQAHTDNAYNLFSKWIGLDLPDELLVPKQDPKPELLEFCKEKLREWGIKENGFILMQLRASSPIRTPRHDFWLKIINSLNDRGFKVILTDNPRQKEKVNLFIDMCKHKDMVFNFCQHSKSIDYSIAITKLAITTVATDSAMNHIAASVGVKSFGIYGPFPGHIRLKTYPKSTWVDAERFCGPCFIHGHEPCKYAVDGYSICYDELIGTDEKLNSLIDKIEVFINK